MRLLLDTHAFLWFVLADGQLSLAAKNSILQPAAQVYVSPASFWETAIKISLGKYSLNVPYETFWQSAIDGNSFEILPIQVRHTAVLTSLPFHHRDPFDRLIVAQAIAEGIAIVSADATLGSVPHPTDLVKAVRCVEHKCLFIMWLWRELAGRQVLRWMDSEGLGGRGHSRG